MVVRMNRLSIITLVLSIIFLLILGYLFFFKAENDIKHAELSGHRVTLVIEGFDDEVDLNVNDDGGPVIAIIIDGIGFLNPNSKLDLPAQVALGMPSYVPYKEYANNPLIMKHNILLNIPLEPINYPEDDPDPEALLIENGDQENLARLGTILDRAQNYHAVYSSYDEKYTNSNKEAKDLLRSLKNKKIIYLSGLTDKNALIYQIANKINFSILENDIILDSTISREEISAKLLELERQAQNSGAAVAIGGSYPVTIELLNEWIPKLADKGIKLLSIQEFYKIISKRKALSARAKEVDFS